jgi:hypothetical protein
LVEGSLVQKQALLGLIGRKYHADYYPHLKLALRSPQAVVRAQAAAVFAKLKEEQKAQLNLSLSKGGDAADDPEQHIIGARAIVSCAESGFIDPPEAGRARAAVKARCQEALRSDPHSIAWQLLLCRVLTADGDDDAVIELLRRNIERLIEMLGAIGDLEKLVIGADPTDTEWLWQRMYRHSYWREKREALDLWKQNLKAILAKQDPLRNVVRLRRA